MALDVHLPFNSGRIPTSPLDPESEEKRYWRLPVPAAAIFAALIARVDSDVSDSLDIFITQRILSHLKLRRFDEDARDNSGGSSGGGGGPSGEEKSIGIDSETSDSETARSEHS